MREKQSQTFPFMEFDKFSLRTYTAKEVQKLAAVQITNLKTFDALGFPLPNGLYDSRLGPSNLNDTCVSCRLPGKQCPGHYGYIHFDVPTFHPVLFPFMYKLMKGSCIHCHRFMCDTKSAKTGILLAQLRCIELGLVSRAEALHNQIAERLGNAESPEENKSLMNAIAIDIKEIDEKIATLVGKSIDELKAESAAPTKNAMDLRNSLMTEYLKTCLFRSRTICPLCKGRNATLRNDENSSLILDFGAKGASKMSRAKMPKKLEEKLDEGPIEEYMEEAAELTGVADDNGVMMANAKIPLREMIDAVTSNKVNKLCWRGAEVREHFRLLWKKEGHVLKKLFAVFDSDETCPMDCLFFEVMLVPPSRYRPIRFLRGENFEDSQTQSFRSILDANNAVICTRLAMDPNREDTFVDQYKIEYERKLRGRDMVEKLHYAYLNLQKMVNNLYDAPPTMKNPSTGIRHLLEKKEGLFRMHMMGKRVNYACRSVITPDPYLDVDEIGIPEIFAKKLTFPAAVSGLNIAQMRKAIESGPENYPGANFISNTGLSDHKNILHKDSRKERLQHSRLLQATVKNSPAVATVFRHLLANEMLLMNRQPSLHKPSIMGHRTRIIRGQRALRMNYAPCKAYNADFDGDEMNGHFIQNTIGQVEAREIANVGSSYLVPKDGTPILGLIQDHVVSGVLLTLRDTFLSKKDFTHLVFAAMGRFPGRIKIPPPSIIHPEKLWTGKQVITAIVRNCIPDGAHLINLQGKAKTSINCWKFGDLPAPKFEMSESEVIFSRGALVNGVLDKAHYGATQYGLIHCCYELYGHKVATAILSCFSRCFTTYLQFHGFSLGVADILVQPAANKERNKIVKQLRLEGDNAAKKAFNLDDDATTAQIKHACAKAYNNNKKDKNDVKMLDFTLKQFLGKHSTNLNNVCVPKGLIRSFPQNSLQLMIQSGAKGSMVNAIQISCALGQIELEGKRPGVSVSGRSLPSFKAFDTTPRAGGFIDQRFLTGICPQELFFHTMAGREGLIDTAVKTSRSGYLQRCIIKHLEGIVACYDGTVRDHDGSVIQFKYGEDGLDVGRATFLNPKQFSFLGRNAVAVSESSIPKEAREEQFNLAEMQKAFRKIKRRLKKNKFATKRIFKSGFTEFSKNYPGMDNKAIVNLWFQMTVQEREEWHESSESAIPDPVDSKFNIFRTLGALPEKMLLEVEDYVEKNDLTDDKLKKALFWKGLRSRVEPGENVGLLAAQSIGEPSTQMTLNTFHFAGRGEMNVTLGIPRLREILMTFGTNIATPSSEARLLDDATPERIEKLKRKFNRVYLSQCVKAVRVEERISVTGLGADRCYVIGVEVSKSKNRDVDARHVSRDKVIRSIENGFIRQVCSQINKMEREMQNFDAFVHRKLKAGNDMIEDGAETSNRNDEQSSDEEVEAGENDAAEARLRNRHLDDAAEYEGEDADAAETAAKSDQGIEASFFQMKEDDSDEELDGANDENEAAADLELSGTIESRKNRILNAIPQCSDYSFDVKGNKWCIYTLMLPLNRNKIDVNMVVRNVVDNYVVHQTEKVEKCVIREETHNGKEIKILQTQGINMDALYDSSDVLDVNSIYSNDLNMMLQKYGVEACNRGIVKEMNNVFGVYGIDVSPRHLTLVADYMTYTGRIAPFSRTAMASSTSPLQKMTFETTMTFMRDTLIGGYDDYLVSPSARIVTGQLIRGGTGLFKIRGDTYHCEQPKTVAESVTKISRVINFNSSEDSD